jgi:hypothetical protein
MEQPSRWQILLKQLWPTLYRVINGTVYFFFRLLIDGIKLAIAQIKGIV